MKSAIFDPRSSILDAAIDECRPLDTEHVTGQLNRAVNQLFRQWIRPYLKLYDLRLRAFTAFHMKRRSRAGCRPKTSSFPTGFRIVDAPIHAFDVVTHRVGHA